MNFRPRLDQHTANATHRALSCLVHPTSLAAIVMLIINDHWLKHTYPSVITGKLSDFAGLYFFPFLFVASLELLNSAIPIQQSRRAPISFLIIACLFAGIQIFPPFANALEYLLSWALDAHVAMTPDPTDLVALTALIPAWHLWRSRSSHHSEPSLVLQLSIYSVAMAAVMATSCIPVNEINQVIIEDGKVYLPVYEYQDGDPYITVSDDKGESWKLTAVDKLPPSISTKLGQEPQLPKTVCSPFDPQECFRITGSSNVEHKPHPGQGWEIDWRYPIWRLGYQKRLNRGPCGVGQIQTDPRDIALLYSESNGAVVFVALGNQGLFIRGSDGSWQQTNVPGVRPIATKADNLSAAWQVIFYERIIFGFAALSVWLILHAMGWKRVLDQRAEDVPSRAVAWWAIRILLFSLIPSAINFVLLMSSYPTPFLSLLSFTILLIGPLITWREKIDPPAARAAADISKLSAVISITLFVIPVLLSLFWALAFIPLHLITVAISLMLYWYTLRLANRKLTHIVTDSSSSKTE